MNSNNRLLIYINSTNIPNIAIVNKKLEGYSLVCENKFCWSYCKVRKRFMTAKEYNDRMYPKRGIRLELKSCDKLISLIYSGKAI